MRRVQLNGKEYDLSYKLSDREVMERRFEGRGLWRAMFGDGRLEDQVVILWAGLRRGAPKLTEPKDVMDLLEEHVEAGGDWDHTIKSAYAAVLEARLFPGDLSTAVRKLEVDDEEGKA